MSSELAQCSENLCERGWHVWDAWWSPEQTRLLLNSEEALWQNRVGYQAARVGAGSRVQRNTEERSDWLRWVRPETEDEIHRAWCQSLTHLREQLRVSLRLPLAVEEVQATRYEVGAFYRPHLDVAREGGSKRMITYVFYLNEAWSAEEGGSLCLYPEGLEGTQVEIPPLAGRLALFRSRDLWHEVRAPLKRARWALSGWFRSE